MYVRLKGVPVILGFSGRKKNQSKEMIVWLGCIGRTRLYMCVGPLLFLRKLDFPRPFPLSVRH